MNHFLGLVILSFCIASIFSLINRTGATNQINYFLKLMAYLVLGSLVLAWIMGLLI